MSKTRKITTLALLMAIHVLLGAFYIPVNDTLRITFSFIPMMCVGIIFDWKTAFLYGIVEDLVAYLAFPSGAFFIGYTFAGGLCTLIYSLFLHNNVNLKNIVLARTTICLLNNIFLNSLWNTVLFANGFFYYLFLSIPKNLIMLPLEILIFVAIYRFLKPLFIRFGLVEK